MFGKWTIVFEESGCVSSSSRFTRLVGLQSIGGLLFILQRNLHVAFYVQLHIFRIVCIDYSDLFTLCLNHYAYADLLLVALHCSISPVNLWFDLDKIAT